jgi:hypothetical protein
MAEQLFNKFSDLGKLEKEKSRILNLFGEIKDGIKELSSLGIKIEAGSSVRETTAAIKKYQEGIERLNKVQAEYKSSEERIIELREKTAKATEREAKAKIAEEKANALVIKNKIAEAKARDENIKAIERENKAKNTTPIIDGGNKGIQPGDNTDGGQITNLNEERDAVSALEKEYVDLTSAAAAYQATNDNTTSSKINFEDEAKEVVVYKDELEKLTGTINENEQLQRLYKNELADISSELKLLEKTTSTADKATADYKNKVNNLISAENNLKKESRELAATIKQQAIEQNSASGSLVQLKARLALATTEYEKMSVTVKESPVGIAIKNEVVGLTKEISKQEQEIGKFQRNVGNYTNKTLTFFKGAYSGLRTFANLIPGLGLSTLFLLIGQQASAAFAIFKKEISDAEKAKKRLNEVNKETVEGYIKEKTSLEGIIARTKDVNTTNEEKKEIIKEVNKAYKDNGIELKTIADLEKFANETAPDLIEAFRLKAKAAAAYGLAIKSATAELELQQYQEKKGKQGGGVFNVVGGAIDNALEKAKNEARKAKEDFLKIQDEALKGLSALEKKNKFDITLGDKKTGSNKSGKGADPLDLIYKNNQERLKAERDYQKQLLQDQINAANIIANNEEASYDERKKALEDYYDYSLALIIKNQGGELAEIREQRKEEIRNAQKDIKDKKQLKNVLLSIEAEYQIKKKLILAKNNSDIIKLDEESGKKQIAVYKYVLDELKKEKEKADKEYARNIGAINEIDTGAVENAYNRELALLDQKLAKKLISEKEYNKKKLLLELNKNIALLKLEIEYAKKIIEVEEAKAAASGNTEDIQRVALAKQKLFDLETKLIAAVAAFQIKKGKETEDNFVDRFTKIAEIAQGVLDIVGLFTNIAANREREIIQEQIDDLERKKQKEIEVAQQSIANADERAKAIDRIEKVAAARREALEQKQREADTRRARFEKAANIAAIVLKTSLAVITALAEGDPLTKIPRALAAGAIGAAQLAIAIATPLPKYAKGKNAADRYEGFAMMGEAGREMRVDKNGQISLYDKPTIDYVSKDTIIYPNKTTEDILAANNLKNANAGNRNTIPVTADLRLNQVIAELKTMNSRHGIIIHNEQGIKSKAWYNKHFKN